jgi:hypothetical protein
VTITWSARVGRPCSVMRAASAARSSGSPAGWYPVSWRWCSRSCLPTSGMTRATSSAPGSAPEERSTTTRPSPNELSRPSSGRTRPTAPRTYVPEPRVAVKRPLAVSSAYARATVPLATPSAVASARWPGIRQPAGRYEPSISSASASRSGTLTGVSLRHTPSNRATRSASSLVRIDAHLSALVHLASSGPLGTLPPGHNA